MSEVVITSVIASASRGRGGVKARTGRRGRWASKRSRRRRHYGGRVCFGSEICHLRSTTLSAAKQRTAHAPTTGSTIHGPGSRACP